jgi:hypothetical protein
LGGWGGIQRLNQASPSADQGRLTVFYIGDIDHTSFDNVAFFDRDHISFVEDRGDTLHTQHNALDSAWMFDVNSPNFCGRQALRWLAQGRDPSATMDSALQGTPGFQNDGDNEITGLHVSDGDPGPNGLLGAKVPDAFNGRWRVFYTQQHGDNVTWEVVPASVRQAEDDQGRRFDRERGR